MNYFNTVSQRLKKVTTVNSISELLKINAAIEQFFRDVLFGLYVCEASDEKLAGQSVARVYNRMMNNVNKQASSVLRGRLTVEQQHHELIKLYMGEARELRALIQSFTTEGTFAEDTVNSLRSLGAQIQRFSDEILLGLFNAIHTE